MNIIFENQFFEITQQNGKVCLKTLQPGFPIRDFDSILRMNPRIKLTNFAVLKNVLAKESAQPVEIGEWLPNVEIEIARDKMSASLFIYETADYVRLHQEELQKDIEKLLAEKNIRHGILPLQLEKIRPGKAMLLAQGTPPMKGDDAQITYLEIPERKPVIREDGKADYYDMNFIFEIQEGSWIGEKICAQPGKEGTDIHGASIPATPGKDFPLLYDKKSAYEEEEEGKVVLRSRIGGVVERHKGQISVNHHLPIAGDVGVETGNLEFYGSITVRGTVQSGFSIIAKGDISIEGPEGVSGTKLIKSIDGDIYIRGGIFGLGQTRVEAGGSIFVKHVNEAILAAGNEIQIGFYSLGSDLRASAILLDERKGKIIGGTATAKSHIVTAISGNRLERRTELIINSPNKQQVYALIQEKAARLKALQEEIAALEEQIERLAPVVERLNAQQATALEQTNQNLAKYREDAKMLDYNIKVLMGDMRSAGKEEIRVTKEAHPGTYIQIGQKSSLLTKKTNGKFLLEFGELNV